MMAFSMPWIKVRHFGHFRADLSADCYIVWEPEVRWVCQAIG